MTVPVSRRLEALEQAARTAQDEPLTVRIVGFDGDEGDALEITMPTSHRRPCEAREPQGGPGVGAT